MRFMASLFAALIAALPGFLPAASLAQDGPGGPEFWAVTGVAKGDVLHLRDVPSADSQSLARIPPNARGLKNLGCRRAELNLDMWVRLSEEERRLAKTLWCRVEYQGVQGWAAGRFLVKDEAAAR